MFFWQKFENRGFQFFVFSFFPSSLPPLFLSTHSFVYRAHTLTHTCLDRFSPIGRIRQLSPHCSSGFAYIVTNTISRTTLSPRNHATAIYQHREFITVYHRPLYRDGAEIPISPVKIALYLSV